MIVASEFWVWEGQNREGQKVFFVRLLTNVSQAVLVKCLTRLGVQESIESIGARSDDRAQGGSGFVLEFRPGITAAEIDSMIERF